MERTRNKNSGNRFGKGEGYLANKVTLTLPIQCLLLHHLEIPLGDPQVMIPPRQVHLHLQLQYEVPLWLIDLDMERHRITENYSGT